jgi:uncharacterized repeat protein (TIGR03803 family)
MLMRKCSSSNFLPLLLFCLATVSTLSAQTFNTIANFALPPNSAAPDAGMIQGFDGNLYGTTIDGGTGGSGTVFEVTTAGQLTTLYSFCSQTDCADGQYPSSALVEDQNGNFWGTTMGYAPVGYGTVFKVTADGVLTTIHAFNVTDGEEPLAGLTLASDGNFYGTTYEGGLNNEGTVFQITPTGTFTTLHNFDSSDGSNPFSGLVEATNGALYGTTTSNGKNGGGTVYKITFSGSLTTVYNFCSLPNCADGSFPVATLIQATGGNLFGTTSKGGPISGCDMANCGTIFKITPSGNLTTLYNFCSEPNCLDGGQSGSGVTQGTDGLFYGSTTNFGANGYGTLFKISLAGKLTVLHAFDDLDGAAASGALMQDTNGTFYGTTGSGGPSEAGTVFSLSTGRSPFVKTSPLAGKIGAAVIILGTHLAGATSVSFNGTAATFSVVSDSEIEATVPAGATTGPLKVITGTKTLKSNTTFRVTE